MCKKQTTVGKRRYLISPFDFAISFAFTFNFTFDQISTNALTTLVIKMHNVIILEALFSVSVILDLQAMDLPVSVSKTLIPFLRWHFAVLILGSRKCI